MYYALLHEYVTSLRQHTVFSQRTDGQNHESDLRGGEGRRVSQNTTGGEKSLDFPSSFPHQHKKVPEKKRRNKKMPGAYL